MTFHNLVVEEIGQLFFGHTLPRVLYGNLHILLLLSGGDTDVAALLSELSGIVGHRVQHEERQHTVGFQHCVRRFYVQFDTFHLEGSTALSDDVEELLQRETLDLQTQFALAQLNPVGQHLVVVFYLVRQFTDILDAGVLRFLGHIALVHALHLVDDTVDKRGDGIHQRDLRTLLQTAALAVLQPQQSCRKFLALLFQQVVGHIHLLVLLVHVVEEPQEEQQQDDGHHHSRQHEVQLVGGLLILTGTGFQLTVLTGGLLQVEIQVAVIVALLFVVDGGIGHTELLTDTRHQIGGLIDRGVGKGLFQIVKRTLVVAYLTVAGSQRTVGTCYLIHVAVVLEEKERVLREPPCEHVVVDILGIDELHGGHVVRDQLVAGIWIHQVFREGLQRIGRKVGIVTRACKQETAHQSVKLLLIDRLLRAFGDDTACTDVIEVVQELGRIALHLVGIYRHQGLYRLSLQSDIIVVGGVHDGIFRLGIEQSPRLVGRELFAFLIDTMQGSVGQFSELMELTIVRLSLTESHLLDIGDEDLYLVVGDLRHLVEQPLRLGVLHLDDMHEGEVVQRLCPTR